MNYTYALTQGTFILRSDGAVIPPDPANTDYAVVTYFNTTSGWIDASAEL